MKNSSKIGVILSKKMTITRKIKIENLVFLSIEPIPDLSCKFGELRSPPKFLNNDHAYCIGVLEGNQILQIPPLHRKSDEY